MRAYCTFLFSLLKHFPELVNFFRGEETFALAFLIFLDVAGRI